MGPRLRNLVVLCTSICVIFFFTLLTGCGASSNPGNNSAGTSGSNSNGSNGNGNGSGSAIVSYAYTANPNGINAYGVVAGGSLTAAPGSPYAASTDTYVVTNGTALFTVDNAGSTLQTYSLNKTDGSLTLANTANAIQGNPYPQDIVSTLALDHTGASLYVSQFDSAGDDGIGIFDVSAAIPRFLTFFSANEQFGPPPVFSPDNQYAYTGNCYHATWSVFGYKRASDGSLTSFDPGPGAQAPPKSDPDTMYCPGPMAVSAKGFLAIGYSELNGTSTSHMIGFYKINFDGTLIPLPTWVVTTASTSDSNATLAISFDPTGTYLAVAGNGGVQTFPLNSNGILPPIGAPQNSGVAFQSVAWDNTNHVFATSQTQLYVYNSQEGQLSPAPGSPQPGGAGLAVLPLK